MSASRLREEIREQPAALRRFIEEESANIRAVSRAIAGADALYAVIAARGTSDNAALYGRYLLEQFCNLPVSLAAPSVYTLYRSPPRLRRALVVGISQSGAGADVTEVVAEGRKQGALTVAITNYPDSPLAQAAEHVILLRAGEERSVAATKTYTAQLYALAWLSACLRDGAGPGSPLAAALHAVPDQMAQVLALEETIAARAERYRYAHRLAVVGRGFNYSTAFEIALKLKELTYLLAEPYSSADFRHGPIAVVEPGFPILLVAPSGATLPDLEALHDDLAQRKAELLVISDQKELLQRAQVGMALPGGVPEWLSPLLAVVPGQLLAYYLALARDLDPENPRTLTKVTSTR